MVKDILNTDLLYLDIMMLFKLDSIRDVWQSITIP